MYRLVPPTANATAPARRISSAAASAEATYRATQKLSLGATRSMQWWAVSARAAGDGLAVPMSIRR